MSRGIMSAFEELQRRMSSRLANHEKYDKDVCSAWTDLYVALGGKITGDYTSSYILPNATRCVALIVSARSLEETFTKFPHGQIYKNGKDGELTDEYKAYQAQPHGTLHELWAAAADACEESVA